MLNFLLWNLPIGAACVLVGALAPTRRVAWLFMLVVVGANVLGFIEGRTKPRRTPPTLEVPRRAELRHPFQL